MIRFYVTRAQAYEAMKPGLTLRRFTVKGHEYWTVTNDLTQRDELERLFKEQFGQPGKVEFNEITTKVPV